MIENIVICIVIYFILGLMVSTFLALFIFRNKEWDSEDLLGMTIIWPIAIIITVSRGIYCSIKKLLK